LSQLLTRSLRALEHSEHLWNKARQRNRRCWRTVPRPGVRRGAANPRERSAPGWFSAWQHLLRAAAGALHVAGRGDPAVLPSADRALGRGGKGLPGTFAVGTQAEACVLHYGVSSIKNKHTLRSHLLFEHRLKPSLNVKLQFEPTPCMHSGRFCL